MAPRSRFEPSAPRTGLAWRQLSRASDPESVYTRFFTYKKALTDVELTKITDVDFVRVVALVMTTQEHDAERLVGGGRYVATMRPEQCAARN